MQKQHNKLLLAGELLVEAADEFRQAKSDVGYAKSILSWSSQSDNMTGCMFRK